MSQTNTSGLMNAACNLTVSLFYHTAAL